MLEYPVTVNLGAGANASNMPTRSTNGHGIYEPGQSLVHSMGTHFYIRSGWENAHHSEKMPQANEAEVFSKIEMLF